jgi:tetratricopeptide (TPR) repeat protein
MEFGYHNYIMKNLHLGAIVTLIFLVIGGTALADQNDPRLDALFEKLKTAPTDELAHEIELVIWHIWSEPQTAGGRVLFRQGMQYMDEGKNDKALESFDALVQIEPEFAEGWNRRATVHYLMGDFDASIADIEHTLALEPRHFGALSGLGLIYDALDQKKAALKAFRAALAIHPHLAGIRQRAKELAVEVEGRAL